MSLGIELVAVDTALAVNQWQRNPLPAVIAARCRQLSSASPSLDARQLTDLLRKLAWNMMQLQAEQQISRRDAEEQAPDNSLIDISIELGLLDQVGEFLRFRSRVYQWNLAAGFISKQGLQRYLTVPQFTASGPARASEMGSFDPHPGRQPD